MRKPKNKLESRGSNIVKKTKNKLEKRKKQYYDENKNTINKQNKNYYKDSKEPRAVYDKVRSHTTIQGCCGSTYVGLRNKSRHESSKQHPTWLKDRTQTAETNKYLLILRTNDIIKCYSSSFRDSKYDLMSCFKSFGVYF